MPAAAFPAYDVAADGGAFPRSQCAPFVAWSMPTLPDAPRPPTQSSGDASLRISFAGSVVVHIAAFAALAVITGGLDRGTVAYATAAGPYLEVALTPPRVAVVDPPVALAVVSAMSASDIVAPAPEPVLTLKDLPMPIAPPPSNSGDGTGGVRPSVSVTDRFPMARFGDFLDGDRLAGFPREVDVPVRLPGELVVPYPLAAWAAREQGIVRVFAIISEDGSVEQSNLQLDQPSPELGKAVDDVLSRTRFIPAEDGGKAIRFYVTLEFVFRIEATDSDKAAGGDATASPPPSTPNR
jgi:TonB family protein